MTDFDAWQAKVASYWESFDGSDPDAMMDRMRALMSERPAGDPYALAEWGAVHDSLNRPEIAVGPYRAALRGGLDAERAHEVTLQLSRMLRDLGEHNEAIELLRTLDAPELGDAPDAFLALVLHSAGRTDDALGVALSALAKHLPRLGHMVEEYSQELRLKAR